MSYSPTGLSDSMVMARMQESVVVPIYKQVSGEFPAPTFDNLRDIYMSDPYMYSTVNFISNRALSRGYHIECNPNVPNHEDAEEFLTDWLDYVRWGSPNNERGYGPLLRIISRELGWGGTSLLETLEPEHISEFAQVQLTSLWKFQRNDIGELTAIWQKPQINPRALTPSRYLMFGWNTIDRNPWSAGLMQPIAMPKPNPITGDVIPPLYAIIWQIQDDIRRRIHRYGGPHTVFGLKGVDEDDSKPIAEYLANPTADASFITDVEVTAAGDAPQGRINFGADLQYMDGIAKAAGGNILTEMITGKGFSYASAVKAGSLADEIVWDMQSVIKTNTEYGILYPVLEQNDFNSILLKPKFVFNPPDPFAEIDLPGLTAALTAGGITKADFVRNAKKLGKLDLDDPLPSMPMQNPIMGQPTTGNTELPGQLITNPSPQPNPLGIDQTAYNNMMQVQQQFENMSNELKRKLEAIAMAGGAASAITSAKKRKVNPANTE